MAITCFPGLSGTSMYWAERSIVGENFRISQAISCRVLSATSWPRMVSFVGCIPKKSQPPSVLRNAQPDYMPLMISPVVSLASITRHSSRFTIVSISCIVKSFMPFLFCMCKGTIFPSHSDTFCKISYGLIENCMFEGLTLSFIIEILGQSNPNHRPFDKEASNDTYQKGD